MGITQSKRIANYMKQNGRWKVISDDEKLLAMRVSLAGSSRLTPKQNRRIKHKGNQLLHSAVTMSKARRRHGVSFSSV